MAFTASIAIAVKGIQDVKALQEQIEAAAKGVDKFNNYAKQAFDGDFVRSIRNLNSALRDATDAFDKAALGTSRAEEAASAYLAANREIIRGLQDRKQLLREVAASEAAQAASALGMKFSLGGPKALPAAGQTSFKGDVVGGLGGGAREALKNYEMLVDAAGKLAARTKDSADQTLRFAQATTQQVRPLNQFAQIYAGIYQQAQQLSNVKALPDTQMLNASARGLQTIESRENKRINRLERVRQKLQEIAAYDASAGKMGNAGFGVQGPAVPPGGLKKPPTGLQKPGVLDAILGGGFPLLFGGGPGAVAGGAAGGFIGGAMGGMAGMALSIGLSAVGQILDDIQAKFTEIQAAAQTLNVDALRDSVLFVNKELQIQLETLIKAGEVDKARAAVAAAIEKQTGVGAGTQSDIANAGAMLKKGFDDAAGALGGFLSILAGPLQVALALVLEGVAQIFRWLNQGLSVLGDLVKAIPVLGGLGEAFKMPNEELEKANAQAQTLNGKLMDEILLKQKSLNLEKQRTLGRTAAEKALNDELDKKQKLNAIDEEYRQKLTAFNEENKNASQQVLDQYAANLEIRKQQAIEEVNIAYQLQEQVRQLDAINERYTIQNQLLANAQAQLNIQVMTAQLSGQITEQRAQELLSANQLLAVQQQLVLARQQLSESAPLLTEQQINEAKAKILSLENQELQIKLQLQQQEVQRIKDEFTSSVAEGLRAPVQLVVDGQQLTASLKNAEQIIQSTLGVVNARYAAEQAINNLLIQRAEQEGDTERVYQLRVRQVELTYRQTIAQIRAEVEQARIKLLQVQLEYQKFDVQMRQIMLIRQLTQEERLQWQGQYDMLQLLKDQYNLTVQAAEYRMQEADAIRKMTMEQLAYNRAKEQSAKSSGGSSRGNFGTGSFFAEGGFIDKPTLAVMGEGGQGEFVIPENKMQTAMQRYASGKRGADVIPQNATDAAFATGTTSGMAPTSGAVRGTAINPQISVTTGPVLELDNKRYVSQDDMVQSLRVSTDKAVEATLKLLRSNTRVRKSLGIA